MKTKLQEKTKMYGLSWLFDLLWTPLGWVFGHEKTLKQIEWYKNIPKVETKREMKKLDQALNLKIEMLKELERRINERMNEKLKISTS